RIPMQSGSATRYSSFYTSTESVNPTPQGKERNCSPKAADRSFSFADTVTHACLIWQNAVLASRIAKLSTNPWVAYGRKGQYLSALRPMGLLYFTEACIVGPHTILGASFRFGGRLHIRLDQLDEDLRESIAPLAKELLQRSAPKPPVPEVARGAIAQI